jgi:hypothetical protein
MRPNLAQVLNTLAHEIRTPLAVSQGYLKLFLDGRLTNAEDTRRAMEQTRQALGALATLCMDMGKVSALADDRAGGVPSQVTGAEFIAALKAHEGLAGATWEGDAGNSAIGSSSPRDLSEAVAIATHAAFDEDREAAHAVRAVADSHLTLLAGSRDALPLLQPGPTAPASRSVDFAKGGKGLKLIWAAFMLDKHGIETWTAADHRGLIGFRIPLVRS